MTWVLSTQHWKENPISWKLLSFSVKPVITISSIIYFRFSELLLLIINKYHIHVAQKLLNGLYICSILSVNIVKNAPMECWTIDTTKIFLSSRNKTSWNKLGNHASSDCFKTYMQKSKNNFPRSMVTFIFYTLFCKLSILFGETVGCVYWILIISIRYDAIDRIRCYHSYNTMPSPSHSPVSSA